MSKPFLVAVAILIAFVAFAPTVFNPAEMLSAPIVHKPVVAMALAMSATVAEPLAYRIREFCRQHGISVPTYYELKKHGLGPTEMRMGAVVRISREAAAIWRAARENPDEAEAKESARTAKAMQVRACKAARRAIASPLHVSRRAAEDA